MQVSDTGDRAQPAVPAMGEDLRAAVDLALRIHEGQVRTTTGTPAIGHALIVCGSVIEWGGSEEQAIAAVLHDAIEAAGSDVHEEIWDRFGEDVASMVDALSDSDEDPKPPWRVRKERHLHQLRTEGPDEVLLVAAAETVHNLRALTRRALVGEDLPAGEAGLPDHRWYAAELLELVELRGLPAMVTGALRDAVEDLTAVVEGRRGT